MLRIYQRMWQVNWAEQWQYRANLLMYLLFWIISPIVYLSVWTTVATSQGNVGGLTANDFATYYLTLLIVDTLTSETARSQASYSSRSTRS
jgi:ABC-2 type transport system permease protein